MSWAQWSAAPAPPAPAAAVLNPAAPVINPVTPVINPAPAVVPPGMQYTPEQWAQLQQQNWNQWAQWQQQYQQWHQQYGAEYQKSMNALAAQAVQVSAPALPNMAVPPPLPTDIAKPPPPKDDPPPSTPSYTSAPPTLAPGYAQPTQAPGYSTAPQPDANNYPRNNQNWQRNRYNKRGHDQGYNSEPKRPMNNRGGWQNQQPQPQQQQIHPPQQPPPPVKSNKDALDELTEAEKKFDKQFADWEAQFTRWKEQNAEHPDKEQYKEYEKKWETWRAQLLDRREQMRKRRLALTSDPQHKPPNSPFKPTSTNPTTLNKPPPTMNDEPLKFKQAKSFTEPIEDAGDFLKASSSGGIPGLDLVKDDGGLIPDNKGDVVDLDPEIEKKQGPDFDAISKGINTILGDQKLMNMLSMVSQNQNVKGDSVEGVQSFDQSNQSYEEHSNHSESYGQRESVNNFDDQTRSSFTHNEQDARYDTSGNFQKNRFDDNRYGEDPHYRNNDKPFSGRYQERPGPRGAPDNQFGQRFPQNAERFGQDQDRHGPNDRGGRFGSRNDRFGPNDREPDRFGPNGRRDQDNFGPSGRGDQERFGPNGRGGDQERFGPNGRGGDQERFGPNGRGGDQERFGPNVRGGDPERFGPNGRGDQERFGPNSRGGDQERFGPNGRGGDQERFGPNGRGEDQERFGPNGKERFGPNAREQERFGPGDRDQERFGDNRNKFNQNEERFGPGGPNKNRFVPKEQERFGFGPGARDNRFGGGAPSAPPPQDRFGPGGQPQDRFGPAAQSRDRFPPPNQDRFESRDRFGPNKFGPKDGEDRFGMNNERFDQDGFGPNQNSYEVDEDKFIGGRNDGEFEQEENFGDDRQFGPPEGVEEDNIAYHEDMEDEHLPPVEETKVEEEPPEDDILKPATVIDYDHKSIKSTEMEILIEPIQMFDYRHKALSRIPYPQRPKWLTETVKNIREFDPPLVRSYEPPNLRRYPPPTDNWRNDRYQDEPPWSHRRYPETSKPFDDRRHSDNRSYGYEERKPFSKDWNSSDDRKKNRPQENWNNSSDDWKKDRPQESWSSSDDWKKDRPQKSLFRGDEEKISDTEWPDDDELNEYEPPPTEKINFNKNNSTNKVDFVKSLVSIEDIINAPGRYRRPPRIVIILRGPPGSGKTYLAKLIKDKEVENGGSTPRILSLDDYFMVEQEREVTEDGKKVKIKDMVFEYEAEMEESYRNSLIRSFKKTITDGYFSFIIVDNVNDKVKYFGEMWSFAKQNGFQVYICQLELDVQTCTRRNIHDRSEEEIKKCVAGWEPTPSHHPVLDATSLLQSASIPEVEMEEVNSPENVSDNDDDDGEDQYRSKWDNFDCSVDNLAKLDGVNKPLRTSRTMEEYLQLDEWIPNKPTRPGQKRVRWADLEEQKQQEKMRAIGFVVGHTDWQRMMDPTGGSSALTQTKYIEKTGSRKVEPK